MNKALDVVIVIPIYKNVMSKLERVSFLRMLEVFKNRSINIVSPASLEDYINELIKDKNIFATFFPEKYFKSIRSYNNLLMSSSFYLNFKNYKYILICQLDVYVINDEIDYWIGKNLDNIGAPIFEGYAKPSYQFKKTGNNGGFCLRKVDSCIKVLSLIKFRYTKLSTLLFIESVWYWKLYRFIRDGIIFNYKFFMFKPKINEDIFWSMIVPHQFKFFKACDPEKSMYFAYDANPKFLYKKCNYKYPMAIHAWWRYDKKFVDGLIEELENK